MVLKFKRVGPFRREKGKGKKMQKAFKNCLRFQGLLGYMPRMTNSSFRKYFSVSISFWSKGFDWDFDPQISPLN